MLGRSLQLAIPIVILAHGPAQLSAATPEDAVELAFFGRDIPAFVTEGRFVDKLAPSDFDISNIDTPISGRDLIRREIGGSNRMPVSLPKAERFAKDIMRRITEKSGITGYEPKIEIVSDDRIFAAAYPDGTVLISLGVFRNLKSSDELAAILAHELSHVILGHHASDWFMDAQERGLAVYKLILDVKAQLDKLKGDEVEDNFFQDLKNRMIAESIVLANDLLLDAPFDRAQEDEADVLGTDLMIKAGFHPDAVSSMLRAVIAQKEEDDAAKEAQRAQRRKNINLSQDRGLFSSIAGSFGDMALELKSEIQSSLGKEHRDPKDRRAMIAEYLELHYTDPVLVKKATAPWEAMVNDTDVANVLTGYRHAIQARERMSEYSIDAAAEESRKALQLLGSEHTLPRKVAAEISFLGGDFERASRFLTEATTGYLASLSIYQGLAETQVKLGEPDAALATLQLATAELKNPPQLLPSKINAFHWRAENQSSGARKAETIALVTQCRLEIIPGLDQLCASAAKGEFSVFNINLPQGMKVTDINPGTPNPNVRMARVNRKAEPARRRAPDYPIGVDVQVNVRGESMNARGGPPGPTHNPVGKVDNGATLAVISQQGDWIEVRDEQGRTFWVAGWLVKLKAEEATKPEPALEPAAAEAPAEAQANEDPNSVEARLRRAKMLYESGDLSEDEYRAARARILESL